MNRGREGGKLAMLNQHQFKVKQGHVSLGLFHTHSVSLLLFWCWQLLAPSTDVDFYTTPPLRPYFLFSSKTADSSMSKHACMHFEHTYAWLNFEMTFVSVCKSLKSGTS